MRWNDHIKPANGATRKVPRFAFLPKKCSNCTVWLEDYISVQRYNALYDLWLEQSAEVVQDYPQVVSELQKPAENAEIESKPLKGKPQARNIKLRKPLNFK